MEMESILKMLIEWDLYYDGNEKPLCGDFYVLYFEEPIPSGGHEDIGESKSEYRVEACFFLPDCFVFCRWLLYLCMVF